MTVTPYSSGDKSAVINLWLRCGLVRLGNNPEQDIERKLKVNPELFLVGLVDGEIMATVMGGYEGHRGWANYLAVAPELQKNGLGRQMMEALEERLIEIGCPKLNLNVRTSNSKVIEFYKRIGYRQDEVVTMAKRFVKDEPFDTSKGV
jgi:ribosomal protein S18 acetylase RimI-like enzyme